MVSALLLGTTMVLVRSAIPADPTGSAIWVAGSSQRHALRVALDLVPFAGIFFLWFMGAVRDYFGKAEDKFFATLFLGGGLLFVAMLFVLSAAAYGLVSLADTAQASSQLHLWQYGRQLVLTLLSSYCTRMAAVLTLSTTTIGHGLGVFPRWLVWLGYLVALVLLFVGIAWSELVFPAWVLTLSGYIFLAGFHRQSEQTSPS
jgi:hypothetical protein